MSGLSIYSKELPIRLFVDYDVIMTSVSLDLVWLAIIVSVYQTNSFSPI